MSRGSRSFELFSTALPDGRRVVQVHVGEPSDATLWLVARNKAEAIARMHDLGVADAAVVTYLRPLSAGVRAAGASPMGGVFIPALHERGRGERYRDLGEWHDYWSRAH